MLPRIEHIEIKDSEFIVQAADTIQQHPEAISSLGANDKKVST